LAEVNFTEEPYNKLLGVSPTLAGLATQYFWEKRKLQDVQDVEQATKLINGGLRGLEKRREYYARALNAL